MNMQRIQLFNVPALIALVMHPSHDWQAVNTMWTEAFFEEHLHIFNWGSWRLENRWPSLNRVMGGNELSRRIVGWKWRDEIALGWFRIIKVTVRAILRSRRHDYFQIMEEEKRMQTFVNSSMSKSKKIANNKRNWGKWISCWLRETNNLTNSFLLPMITQRRWHLSVACHISSSCTRISKMSQGRIAYTKNILIC